MVTRAFVVQVLQAAPAAPVVIIADCPTANHLPSLMSSAAWATFRQPHTTASGSSKQVQANCIVHLAPPQVCPHPLFHNKLLLHLL